MYGGTSRGGGGSVPLQATRRLVRRLLPRGRGGETFHNCRLLSSRAQVASTVATIQNVRNLFLLQVHPDFLWSHPRERRINGENLKILNNHLDHHSTTTHQGLHLPSLIFYLVKGQPQPQRVTVPLSGCLLTSLINILQTHCNLPLTPPPPPPPPPPTTEQEPFHHHQHYYYQQQARKYHTPHPFPTLSTFLTTLNEDEIRSREQSSWVLAQEIEEVIKKWGFREVIFGRDWSCENLVVVVTRLREALEEHGSFLVRHGSGDFAGFALMLGGMGRGGLVEEEGVIGLSPSDPPLLWIEALLTVGEQARSRRREEEEKEMGRLRWLEEVWGGGGRVVVKRGKSCPRSVFRRCLEQWVEEGGGVPWCTTTTTATGGEGEDSQKGLRLTTRPVVLRVEHGHRPCLLGSSQGGGLQVSSEMTLADLSHWLKDCGPEARSRQMEYEHEREEVKALEEVVRQGLGLEDLGCEVGTKEAKHCLERLGGESDGIRRGLVGRKVVVGMGSRCIGLTSEGAVRLPWDYRSG